MSTGNINPERERAILNQAITQPETFPLGYQPGIRADEHVQAEPMLSRADEPFKPARQLRDEIDTKHILRDNIVRAMTDEYYQREKARLTGILTNVQMQLTGLELNREQGPDRIAAVDRDIQRLQEQLVATQNKADLEKLFKQMVALQNG